MAGGNSADLGTYDYHPKSKMTVGKGYDPLQPDEEKRLCYDFAVHQPEEGAALETTLDSYAVTTSRELTVALGFDTKVDASYLVFKGGGQFSMSSDFKFTSNSVSLVMVARSEYGRQMLKNEKLYPQYEAMLAQGRMAEFEQFCGSRIVSTEVRGASVSVVITLENVTQEQKLKISTDGYGGGQIGPIGGEAKAHFEALYHKKSARKEVSYRIFARGGTGLKSLDTTVQSMITSGEQIDRIADGLRQFVSQFDAKYGVPVRFYTSPIDPRLNPSHVNLLDERKEQMLSELVWAYRGDRAIFNTSRQFITASWDPRKEWFTYEYLVAASSELKLLEAYLEQLAQTHAKCLKTEIDSARQACELPRRPETPRVDHIAGLLN